jgi:uncharacterized MAPEG superfamily protein
MNDLKLLVLSVLLTWLMLLVASFIRNRSWTSSGVKVVLGNRANLPPATALSGRADRAAKNMLENLVLFSALLLAAHLAGGTPAQIETGATLFFWGRVAFFALYLAGIPYLRTIAWGVSVIGMGIIAATGFSSAAIPVSAPAPVANAR